MELGQLTQLEELHLDANQLTGEIPVELGQLSQLQRLELGGMWNSDNRLTGEIPVELARLSQLSRLEISNTQLTGTIPPELGQLSLLERLLLNNNRLTGEIPVELAQLSQLTYLNLGNNPLTGEVPPELAQLSQLKTLYLFQNRLTGEIPVELAQLSQLENLVIQLNQLTGEIPVELTRLSELRRLDLSYNQLTGKISPELARLSKLARLSLYNNRLTGEIPVELAQLSQLQYLYLGYNQLTGEIPAELAQLSQLRSLFLNNNQLTGEIPVELAQLSQLRSLLLNNNQLTGEIPVELAQLSQLRSLLLNNNQLTGEIPVELAQLSQLWSLNLSNNGLTGGIPAELAQLSQLRSLDLDNNRLTGEIPASLSQLTRLVLLHLQHNQLTGEIPAQLGQLSNLQQFSYRGNQLTGSLPSELSELPEVYVRNLAASWMAPGQIRVTWDDPIDPTAVYEYQLTATASEPTDWRTIDPANLRAGAGTTIEWTLTGVPAEIWLIGMRATNEKGVGPVASVPVSSSPPFEVDLLEDPYCLSLWDGSPCDTAANLSHVLVGPLSGNDASTEILITNRDPDSASCDVAVLFHRGTAEAPEVSFNGESIDDNLLLSAIPSGGAELVTLTSPGAEELAVGSVYVFTREPCSADSLRVQGRFLLEDEIDGAIDEIFSVSGQSPQEWLGDGDCQVLTGIFGAGRNVGLATVTTEPEQEAPSGTQLHFRSFDLSGNPTGAPDSLEITGKQSASFPWSFQKPTTVEMCLEVPEENSEFRISTIAIGVTQKGGQVQWSDETIVDQYPLESPSAWSAGR